MSLYSTAYFFYAQKHSSGNTEVTETIIYITKQSSKCQFKIFHNVQEDTFYTLHLRKIPIWEIFKKMTL